MNLHQRAQATRPVIAQFNRPFSWKRRTTCAHLLRAQLVAMGHTPPPLPLFTSPQGGWRALRKRGHAALDGWVDSLLPERRIPPACMIVGDVAIAPGVLGAVLIETGSGLIGWSDWDLSCLHLIEIDRNDLIGAWRT